MMNVSFVVSLGQTTIEMFESRSHSDGSWCCSPCGGGQGSGSGKRLGQRYAQRLERFVRYLKAIHGTDSFWMIFLPRYHADVKVDELDPDNYQWQPHGDGSFSSLPLAASTSSPAIQFVPSVGKDLDV